MFNWLILHFLFQVLNLDPKNVKAMYRQSQACCEMKDFDQAKNILTETLKLDPENKGEFSVSYYLINHYTGKLLTNCFKHVLL